MPRAHGDCTFRDQWLVQDKYKAWVVKDGDQRLARCKKSSSSTTMAMHREVKLNFSFVAKNYFYFFPERCDHKK